MMSLARLERAVAEAERSITPGRNSPPRRRKHPAFRRCPSGFKLSDRGCPHSAPERGAHTAAVEPSGRRRAGGEVAGARTSTLITRRRCASDSSRTARRARWSDRGSVCRREAPPFVSSRPDRLSRPGGDYHHSIGFEGNAERHFVARCGEREDRDFADLRVLRASRRRRQVGSIGKCRIAGPRRPGELGRLGIGAVRAVLAERADKSTPGLSSADDPSGSSGDVSRTSATLTPGGSRC